MTASIKENQLVLWGRKTSSNVQIVAWALTEMGLPYEHHEVGGAFGGTDTPAYRGMNPNGLVPTLQDGELTLWESAAVVRYLGASYGDETFWPRDPRRRAPLDMWAEWIKTTFVPAFITGVFWPSIRMRPGERDTASIETAVQALKGVAAIIDRRLAQGDYIGGDELCFADCVVGTLLYRYFTLDFERADLPALRAYYDRLTKRPAYAEHVMVSYDSLRAT